jgi:hypothetical protein
MNSVPTERDWRGSFVERLLERVVFGSRREDLGLDGEHAYQQFFAKTHSEAVEMFKRSTGAADQVGPEVNIFLRRPRLCLNPFLRRG